MMSTCSLLMSPSTSQALSLDTYVLTAKFVPLAKADGLSCGVRNARFLDAGKAQARSEAEDGSTTTTSSETALAL